VPSPETIALAAAALLVEADPERVLEIECGEGSRTLFLAREFPRARVRGVDSSAEEIRAATARVGLDPEGRIAFKAGEPTALPFPDDHFDLVAQAGWPSSSIEIARVLRPGGSLILVSAAPWRGRLGLRRRWLDRRLSRAGFEPVKEGRPAEGHFLFTRLRDPGSGPLSD
jgi:ubiquinone/menaquinone biosynthesis C-methylase UbiE